MGHYFSLQKNYKQAKKCLLQSTCKMNNPQCLLTLGRVCYILGQEQESQSYFLQVIKSCENSLTTQSVPTFMNAVKHLYETQIELGNFINADVVLRKSWYIFIKTPNISTKEFINFNIACLILRGNMLANLGYLEHALHYLNTALEMCEYDTTYYNPHIIDCLSSKATTYFDKGDMYTSDKLFMEILQIREGVSIDLRRATLIFLAKIAYNCNSYTRAYEFIYKALELFENNHPSIELADIYYLLGEILYAIGNYTDAIQSFEVTLQNQQYIYGTNIDNIDIASTLFNLGSCHIIRNSPEVEDLGCAYDYLLHALNMRFRLYRGSPKPHESIPRTIMKLASIHSLRKNFLMEAKFLEDGLKLFLETSTDRKEYIGDILNTIIDLGLNAMNQGKQCIALKYFTDAMNRVDKLCPKNQYLHKYLNGLLERTGTYIAQTN